MREDTIRLIQEQEEWKRQQCRIEAEENEKISLYIIEHEDRSKIVKEVEQKKRLAIIEQQEKMCTELEEIEVIFL